MLSLKSKLYQSCNILLKTNQNKQLSHKTLKQKKVTSKKLATFSMYL